MAGRSSLSGDDGIVQSHCCYGNAGGVKRLGKREGLENWLGSNLCCHRYTEGEKRRNITSGRALGSALCVVALDSEQLHESRSL